MAQNRYYSIGSLYSTIHRFRWCRTTCVSNRSSRWNMKQGKVALMLRKMGRIVLVLSCCRLGEWRHLAAVGDGLVALVLEQGWSWNRIKIFWCSLILIKRKFKEPYTTLAVPCSPNYWVSWYDINSLYFEYDNIPSFLLKPN